MFGRKANSQNGLASGFQPTRGNLTDTQAMAFLQKAGGHQKGLMKILCVCVVLDLRCPNSVR